MDSISTTDYHQGEYAGPLTQRAMDYNGHEVIGVQISDTAPDGACFFITLDKCMQISIAPVIAASLRPYEPDEPPPLPEIEPEDYAATRASLEMMLRELLSKSIERTGQLYAGAIIMNELAKIIEIQQSCGYMDSGARAAQAAGQALHSGSSADVPSAERGADAEREAEVTP